MVEVGDGTSFCKIGVGVPCPCDQFGVRDLNRDQSFQLIVVSEIDESKAALSQQPFNPITTNSSWLFNCRDNTLMDWDSMLIGGDIVGGGILHATRRNECAVFSIHGISRGEMDIIVKQRQARQTH